MRTLPLSAKDDELMGELADISATPDWTLRESIRAFERNQKGLVVICDEQSRPAGTVNDGDIRRALLQGHSLDDKLADILEYKRREGYARPITQINTTPRNDLIQLMQDHVIHQLPLVDASGRLTGVVTLNELLPERPAELRAVVMAGGFGTRLAPLTQDTPKPMLPVGEKPLLEHIIRQVREAGVQDVNISTHYRPEKIREHFEDGAKFGVNLSYLHEAEPQGTAGALRDLPAGSEPLLVINGDILSRVDIQAMLSYHRSHSSRLTVGVRQYDVEVPYGVTEVRDGRVVGLSEKPVFNFFVNAGIYVVEPAALGRIPPQGRFDMTDLIQALVKDGDIVASFPIHEYWLDVGRHEDYCQAQLDYSTEEKNQ